MPGATPSHTQNAIRLAAVVHIADLVTNSRRAASHCGFSRPVSRCVAVRVPSSVAAPTPQNDPGRAPMARENSKSGQPSCQGLQTDSTLCSNNYTAQIQGALAQRSSLSRSTRAPLRIHLHSQARPRWLLFKTRPLRPRATWKPPCVKWELKLQLQSDIMCSIARGVDKELPCDRSSLSPLF
jgi:hypothetical protein